MQYRLFIRIQIFVFLCVIADFSNVTMSNSKLVFAGKKAQEAAQKRAQHLHDAFVAADFNYVSAIEGRLSTIWECLGWNFQKPTVRLMKEPMYMRFNEIFPGVYGVRNFGDPEDIPAGWHEIRADSHSFKDDSHFFLRADKNKNIIIQVAHKISDPGFDDLVINQSVDGYPRLKVVGYAYCKEFTGVKLRTEKPDERVDSDLDSDLESNEDPNSESNFSSDFSPALTDSEEEKQDSDSHVSLMKVSLNDKKDQSENHGYEKDQAEGGRHSFDHPTEAVAAQPPSTIPPTALGTAIPLSLPPITDNMPI